MKVEQFCNVGAQFTAINDIVDHAMFKEEFGPLKVLRQFLADRLFNDTRTGETDQCFWFQQ